MNTIVSVIFFGLIGVLSRYGIEELYVKMNQNIITATLLINILGSFLIGILFALSNEKLFISPNLTRALTVGLLGGFTTFSSYSLQSLQLFINGNSIKGALYFLGSPILGLLSCAIGVFIAKFF